jgi:hypothetical protein
LLHFFIAACVTSKRKNTWRFADFDLGDQTVMTAGNGRMEDRYLLVLKQSIVIIATMASSPSENLQTVQNFIFGFETRLLRMFTASTSLFAPNSIIQTELGKTVTHHHTVTTATRATR